eukprot:CAMPEP_0201492618 /NCGR_PEP_ID=MMETSP0151_2-20130828/34030_1 /ASSEMBLY_ACC=CAM_ASM_000257 /TAXON_ID=200890 /ORGANISM="Paramoeba atlantica, Strain 621/1 / CCAP 1560/9" /LENGTH=610 /DNA_ID=CAMNT_0047879535 /DNA_START=1 /DNA_END=1833 /DNA_ORIENTATION=-
MEKSFLSFFLFGFLFCVVVSQKANEKYVPILVALQTPLENIEKGNDRFWELANPKSKSYLSYPSGEEMKELFGCPQHHLDQLLDWFRLHRALDVKVAENREWLTARVPSSLAKKMKEQLDLFPSERNIPSAIHTFVVRDRSRVRPSSSSSLDSSLDSSSSSSSNRNMEAYKKRRGEVAESDTVGDINAQREAYGVPVGYQGSNETNKQMVWGSGTYGILESDMIQFFSAYGINEDLSLIEPKGRPGYPPGDNFAEATLDVQYIGGMANNITTVAWNNDDRPISEFNIGMGDAMLEFMYYLSMAPTDLLPKTLSLSLGSMSWYSCNFFCEKLVEEHPGEYSYFECFNYSSAQFQVCVFSTKEIEDRISLEFMKLGMRGVTILAAAGDGGAHFSFQRFPDKDPIGHDLNEVCCNYTFTTFPCESPYVVAVGGTQWIGTTPSEPHAWFATGGGFSWGYSTPDFQTGEVNSYVAQNKGNAIFPQDGQFNPEGRAVPDVATLAEDIPYYWNGKNATGGGTSFSCPEWAGVISLVNDYRLNQNLPPLGPVAPRLYQEGREHTGELFLDVTEGDNRRQADGRACDTGFPAVKGWDSVTGWGRPIFDGLIKYLGDDSH